MTTGLIAALSGCGGQGESEADFDAGPRRRPTSSLPEALMVRFREVKGEGSKRESWEVEVLQMGGDVRVTGSIRSGSVAVPISGTMPPGEYVEFWQWLRTFPLDRARPAEARGEPRTDWRKSLAVDVVLDEETRWKSHVTWSRPLENADWVTAIEQRLHELALVLANREVDRRQREAVSESATLGSAPAPSDEADPARLGELDVD